MTINKQSSATQTEHMFTVSNPFRFEASINSVKEKRRKSMRNPILACVIKQYGTGLYRTCVSFDKGHTAFMTAHPDEESATETINRFEEACQDGTIKTVEDVTSFATSLIPTGDAIHGPPPRESGLILAA
jgi:hypothetical protein